MSVTLYSLGDHEIIRAGLTAVVMLFDSNNTDLLTGAGAAGLGHAAAFGLLVSLGWIAMRVLVGQPFSPGHLIAIMLAYIIMFVPKTTVVVEDIYSGQASVVDDVPIGIALPGGFISGVSRSITLKLDQALRLADAETSSLTEDGMVSPLKLMLAARGAALIDHAFTLSFSRYIADCTDGIPPNAINTATSPYLFLDNPFPTFSTIRYPTGLSPSNSVPWTAGEHITCTDAAGKLADELRNYLQSSEYNDFLTQQMRGRRPNATLNGRWEAGDLQMFINNFAEAGVNAQDVMAQLAASDIIADTYRCGSLDTQSAINCSSVMRSAVEGYKFDAAGKGSVFARTMIPSMNVFMFLFFAVAPLIAVVIAVSGMHGVTKVMPNYLLFGVWTQSWLPMAAIINHFILRQSRDAAQLGLITANGLQLKAGPQFYDLLSTKVAAASDLLASTPIVTFAIISGSIMGLAQLANKAGDHVNEKNIAPDVSQTGAAVGIQNRQVEAPRLSNAGMTRMQGLEGTGLASSQDVLSFNTGSERMRQLAVGAQYASEIMQADAQKLSQDLYQGFGAKMAGSLQKGSGTFAQADYNQMHGQTRQFGEMLSNGIKASNTESTLKSLGLSSGQLANVALGAMLDAADRGFDSKGQKQAAGAAIKGTILQAAKNLGGIAPNAQMLEQASNAIENSIGQQFSSQAAKIDQWSAKFSAGKKSSDEQRFLDEVSKSDDKKIGENLSRTLSESKKATTTAQELDSQSTKAGSASSVSGARLAQLAVDGVGVLGNRLSQLRQEEGISEQQAIDTANKVTGGKFLGDETPGDALRNRQLAAAYGTAYLLQTKREGEIASALTEELGAQKLGSPKSGAAITAEFGKRKASAPQRGLSPQTTQRIDNMAQAAGQAASRADSATSNVPNQIEARRGAASQTVTEGTFNNFAQTADVAANASGAKEGNNAQAMASTSSQQFAARAAALQAEYKDKGSISSLAARFGNDLGNDQVLSAIYAAAGVGVAAATVQDIMSGYGSRGGGGPTTTGGSGGKGGNGAMEYTKQVLEKVG